MNDELEMMQKWSWPILKYWNSHEAAKEGDKIY
jgi:hypothetical protein